MHNAGALDVSRHSVAELEADVGCFDVLIIGVGCAHLEEEVEGYLRLISFRGASIHPSGNKHTLV